MTKNKLFLIILVSLVFCGCKVTHDEYRVLVAYGHHVCDDRQFLAACDNYIPVGDRYISYQYKLPNDVNTRLDAQIFYWTMAEKRFSDRPDHKVYLKNALKVRGNPEDKAMIDKLSADMKRMKISDSL